MYSGGDHCARPKVFQISSSEGQIGVGNNTKLHKHPFGNSGGCVMCLWVLMCVPDWKHFSGLQYA